jgi:hypothetical protein
MKEGDDALWDWFSNSWEQVDSSNGWHEMLVVPMDESVGEKFFGKRSTIGTLQLRQVHELGEKAIRPAMLALRLLHKYRMLLVVAFPSTSQIGSPLSTGFSPAFYQLQKIDRLSLAQALRRQIKTIG